jgi:hypothetical protein
LIDLAGPVVAGPAAEGLAADEASLVVVGAEVAGAGVGDLDGDDGGVGFEELGGDDGGDALVGLEFEDKVDAFLDEDVGVAESFAGGVAVVDGDEVEMFASGGYLHRFHDLAGELGVSLGGEADAEGLGGDRAEAVAIDSGAGTLQQAAVDKSAEEAKDGCLGQAGAFDDLGELELFAKVAEGLEHFAGAEDGLGFVAIG